MSIALHPITAAESNRIAAIAARLQSDHEGEVVNASRMLIRALDKFGLRIGEVVERGLKPVPVAEPTWRPEPMSPQGLHRILVNECLAGTLNKWETDFVRDLLDRRSLSQRQAEVLTSIVNKVRRQRRPGGGA